MGSLAMGDIDPHGLAFTKTDGDVFALPVKKIQWRSIKLDLLQKQEAFFEYTRLCLLTVDSNLVPILAGNPQRLKMPKEIHQPHMHSQWSRQAQKQVNEMPTIQP